MSVLQDSSEIIMEAVGEALKGIVDEVRARFDDLDARLDQIEKEGKRQAAVLRKEQSDALKKQAARVQLELDRRDAALERLVAASAPKEVVRDLLAAIKALPVPQLTVNPEMDSRGLVEAIRNIPASNLSVSPKLELDATGLVNAIKAMPEPHVTVNPAIEMSSRGIIDAIRALPEPHVTINPELAAADLVAAIKAMPEPHVTVNPAVEVNPNMTFSPVYNPPAVEIPEIKVPQINVPQAQITVQPAELTLPERFVLEMPARKEHKDISYDAAGRPVSIDTREETVEKATEK